MGFYDVLGIETILSEKNKVIVTMPITPEIMQPFGYVHGGATLALLETAASIGAAMNTDFEKERPFGVDVQVRHRKGGKEGMLRGEADLVGEELSQVGGVKQFWKVVAYDDAGDTVSEGTVMTKVVPLSRLAQKEKE